MKYLVSLAVVLCFFRFMALAQTYQTLRGDETPTPSTTPGAKNSSWSGEATFITPGDHNEDGNETNNQRKFKKPALISPGNESVEISAAGFSGIRNSSSELDFNELAENGTSEDSKIKSIPLGENDIGDSGIKHDDKTRLETQIQSTTLSRDGFKGWSEGKGDIHMTGSQSADRRLPGSIPGDVSREADYVASARIKDIQKQDGLKEGKKHPREQATHIWSSTQRSEEILTASQSNREMRGRFSAKTRGGTGGGREAGSERLNDSDIATRDDKGNWFSLISSTFAYETTTPTLFIKNSRSASSNTSTKTTAESIFQSISEDLINNFTTRTRTMQALEQVKEESTLRSIPLTSSFPGSSVKGRASSETAWKITESGSTTPRILNESAFTNKEDFTTLKGFTASSVELYERTTLSPVPQVVLEEISWPVKREAVVEGDVILGGLMMVHEREDSITCGPVMPQGGVQALEAMLYTVDAINFRLKPRLLPGFTLGAHVLDDCDKDTYGLEMAVDFIKGLRVALTLSANMRLVLVLVSLLAFTTCKKPHLHRHHLDVSFDVPSHRRHRSAKHSLPLDVISEEVVDLETLSRTYHLRHHPDEDIPWPVKKEAVVEGDVVLGGLMMVHEREDSVTCGPVMPQGGVQALEAMLYTVDAVNLRLKPRLLPGFTIGAHVLDDCDKDTYGLEMAVDFIKGSISNIDGAEYHCNKTQIRKVISGVVGAASSVTSIQVANLLRLFKIPQVSFFSTSPELSNKQRFEFFTRTIPSDHYQVKAMVDIVRLMGWSYVSIIYEESNYGIKAFEELEELLAEYNICIAIKEKLVKDSGVAEEIAYDNLVLKLLTKPRARGCIIFGSDQEVAGVMRAVRRNNATGSFSWIGSDGWSARSLVSDGNEAEVEGTLSVQPQANPVVGFEDYFLGLNVENNPRNPWFVEFWEDHFQCRYPNSSKTPYNHKYTKHCTGKEKLTKQNTVFEDQLQFVSDAVLAFAYALRDMHHDLCGGHAGLCDAMKPTKGTELLKYLRKVDFEGLTGDRFHFDVNGDGPARYNIIHFKQVEGGKYRWIRVGEYVEGELRLNMSEIQFKMGHPKPPESVCSLPCDLGQAKKYVEGESCCWHCFNCTQYQIRHPTDPTQCIQCPQGAVPDSQHVRCRPIPEEFLRPASWWAIGAMAFSSFGVLTTLFVCGVFIRHNDTPVVRASGRELSYVLLAGILMCYGVTYALVLRPSDIVCGIQRFGAGFCFTVVYAALLTKTNRISRIFNAGKHSAKRPSFISPKSQLFICSGLVGVQVLINGVWIVISPARAIHHYPTREDNLLVCSSYIDASYMIAFTYPIVLIVICTVYAVLTRKIPEAFNESKHIGFTMYTTCVIWLAFVPLYFGTANHVALRITSMSVTISLSASVTVACLFSPKLYIILIRPERNVRQSMMPMRYSAINKSSTTAGSGSMMAAVMVTAATCDQKEKLDKHVPVEDEEETDGSDYKKSKPATKDSSTQTQDPLTISNGQEPGQKLNNNCNGPLSLLPGVQIKDLKDL